MKYQPLNDLIDPDVPPPEAVIPQPVEDDPTAPNEAYVIGERGNTVQAPDVKGAEGDREPAARKWVKPTGLFLAAVCVVLTVWNVSRFLAGPPIPPKPSPFQVKQVLYLGVMKVEAYRRVHGVTPGGLADVDLPSPPYAYTRLSSTQYAIAFDGNGSRLEYESSVPMERFFGTPQEMLAIGGSQ